MKSSLAQGGQPSAWRSRCRNVDGSERSRRVVALDGGPEVVALDLVPHRGGWELWSLSVP